MRLEKVSIRDRLDMVGIYIIVNSTGIAKFSTRDSISFISRINIRVMCRDTVKLCSVL